MCGSNYEPYEPMSEDEAERTLECRIAKSNISVGKAIELGLVPFSFLMNVSAAYWTMERAGRSFSSAHKLRMYSSASVLDLAKLAALGYAIHQVAASQ